MILIFTKKNPIYNIDITCKLLETELTTKELMEESEVIGSTCLEYKCFTNGV